VAAHLEIVLDGKQAYAPMVPKGFISLFGQELAHGPRLQHVGIEQRDVEVYDQSGLPTFEQAEGAFEGLQFMPFGILLVAPEPGHPIEFIKQPFKPTAGHLDRSQRAAAGLRPTAVKKLRRRTSPSGCFASKCSG
jgi:hypothetical protein